MACSLAVDLRLNAKTRDALSNVESVMLVPLSYLPESEEQMSARRTYAGCYYVTSLSVNTSDYHLYNAIANIRQALSVHEETEHSQIQRKAPRVCSKFGTGRSFRE